MLQSSRLEDHMKTICIDQSLCISYYFEHKYMNNIKKIYQHASKCDDQQNLKDVLDASVVSNPEVVTDNIPNVPMTSTPVNKPSARKSMCLFTNIFNVKNRIANHCILDAKSKRRAMKVSTSQWTKKIKRQGYSKIN